jgi:hypothetical protein
MQTDVATSFPQFAARLMHYNGQLIRCQVGAWETMAKRTLKLRPWTKEDVRTLTTLAREKTKTTVIARKLKRSLGGTHQKAMRLGVTLSEAVGAKGSERDC